ncbi:MAG: hypothetical protein LBM08_04005, partial [Dysgonamonadaceae bacterium]|nr:hypothetical protein [Dysgonamonadaceae bacterium]
FAKRIGVPAQQLLGRGRTSELTVVRALYWYILLLNGFGYSEIGRMGNRTHSTIISGIKRVKALLEVGDSGIVQMFEVVKSIKRYS